MTDLARITNDRFAALLLRSYLLECLFDKILNDKQIDEIQEGNFNVDDFPSYHEMEDKTTDEIIDTLGNYF